MKSTTFLRTAILSTAVITVLGMLMTGCGARQQRSRRLDTRPLEESKAFSIVNEIVTKRGYGVEQEINVQITTGQQFAADFRVAEEKMAIEFLTGQDMMQLGTVPAPAPGSRLHVVIAKTVPSEENPQPENLYLFFIDDRNFVYQFNPTSETRADVTLLEVEARLKRDLEDFLSWYENQAIKK